MVLESVAYVTEADIFLVCILDAGPGSHYNAGISIISEESAFSVSEEYESESDPKVFLMEKRIGLVAVLITERNKQTVIRLNEILTKYHDIIMARQGLPVHSKGIHLISLVVEGSSDEIGALSGQIGRLPGISVKSVLTPYKEGESEDDSEYNNSSS